MSKKKAKPLPGAMTVKQVRDLLAGYPDVMPLIVQKDGEGNDFSPLCEMQQFIYVPINSFSGELHDDTDVDEESQGDGAVQALFLVPIN